MLERRLSGLVVLALAASCFALTGTRVDHTSASAQAGPPPVPSQNESSTTDALPAPAGQAQDPASARAAQFPGTAAAIEAQGVRPQASPVRGLPLAVPLAAAIRQSGFEEPPAAAAKHVEIVDEATGKVLYEKASHTRIPIASVTKMMTALLAIERGKLADTVNVNFDDSELYDSTMMGCLPGDQISLEDMLYGLMLPSGNDAALAIANHIAGSVDRFVQLMNDRAAELGMVDTHFANPHGLDVPEHYSSAHDMAVLARFAMRSDDFRKLAAAKQWTVRSQRGQWVVYNLNKLLWRYAGADGVKIGYEDRAGKTMVASATRNGQRVYIALMNTTDLVADAQPLYDWVFRNFTWDTPR